jgi:RNA polymerase sigma-70 factor (ECF subfamily)
LNFSGQPFVCHSAAEDLEHGEPMAADRSAATERIRRHLLVLRCQAGDARAFEALYAEFGPITLRYLDTIVEDAAEDIQQDVWLTVYRRLGSLADPAGFRTWLLATTRNRAIDWLRKRKRETRLLDASATEIAAHLAPSSDSSGLSFDDPAVRAALATLPVPQREVLMLRYRSELAYGEIAVVTGCAIGTVRSRLHHARHNLEREIQSRLAESN